MTVLVTGAGPLDLLELASRASWTTPADACGGEDEPRALGTSDEPSTNHGALLAQLVDDVSVVDDLVATVDGLAADLEGLLDNLDGAAAGAEAADLVRTSLSILILEGA